jgi:hypothetical protein
MDQSLTGGSLKELLLSVYTQTQEGSSGKASDWPLLVGILSFRGVDQTVSVSRGGKLNFKEFNLSCLYQQYQD